MKNRFLLISLCLLLFTGCNNNTVSTGLPAGASKQIQIDGTNICYSVNVLDVNSHYVEVEISAFYDDDYYFEDQAQHNLFDSTMGYYDLAILGDDIISSCEIGGVEIPLSCYAGGVFYGNKQAYAVLIGKENPTKIKLNFSTKQYSASQITVTPDKIVSPKFIKCGFEKEDVASHTIYGLKIELAN